MRRITTSVVVLLVLSLAAAPIAADVIPNRIEDADRGKAAEKVVKRLTDLGIDENRARTQVRALSDDSLAHYADAPQALQFVGQAGPTQGQDVFAGESYNMWYESVIGILSLGAAIAAIFISVTNHED